MAAIPGPLPLMLRPLLGTPAASSSALSCFTVMASSALSGGPAGAETYETNNSNKKRVQTTDAGFA